jgi:hypothetical protein
MARLSFMRKCSLLTGSWRQWQQAVVEMGVVE